MQKEYIGGLIAVLALVFLLVVVTGQSQADVALPGVALNRTLNTDAAFMKEFAAERLTAAIAFDTGSGSVPLMNLSLVQNTYLCNSECLAVLEINRPELPFMAPPLRSRILDYIGEPYFFFDFENTTAAAPGL